MDEIKLKPLIDPEPCNGQVYEGVVSSYISKNGKTITQKKELIYRPSISCKGCEYCESCHDDNIANIQECNLNCGESLIDFVNLEDGKYYHMNTVWSDNRNYYDDDGIELEYIELMLIGDK